MSTEEPNRTPVSRRDFHRAGLASNTVAGLVSEPYSEDRVTLPAFWLGIGTTILLICFGTAWYWYLVTWVIAFAAMSVIMRKAFIELDPGVVREETWLYGVVLLARRTIPLSEFEAVLVQHIKGGPEDNRDDWRVGLQHRSGRRMWMRYCEKNVPWRSDPEDAVGGFAMMLSEKTRLPIQDIDPPDPGPWLRRVKLRRGKN